MIDVDWNRVAADVLIALEPILVAALVALVGAAFAWVREHYAAVKASKALLALEEAVKAEVTDAGTATVNQLKADGRWGPGEGERIKDAVGAKILGRLPADARAILDGLLGDLATVIGSKIEQQVVANQASGVQTKLGAMADPTLSAQSGPDATD